MFSKGRLWEQKRHPLAVLGNPKPCRNIQWKCSDRWPRRIPPKTQSCTSFTSCTRKGLPAAFWNKECQIVRKALHICFGNCRNAWMIKPWDEPHKYHDQRRLWNTFHHLYLATTWERGDQSAYQIRRFTSKCSTFAKHIQKSLAKYV